MTSFLVSIYILFGIGVGIGMLTDWSGCDVTYRRAYWYHAIFALLAPVLWPIYFGYAKGDDLL